MVSRGLDNKRGLAYGIATSGAGLGAMVMAPFATFLISTLDWRKAYIIIGTISLIIVTLLSRLLKKSPDEIGVQPDGIESGTKDIVDRESINQHTGLSLPQAVRTRSFWLITFVWLFFAYGIFFIFAHLVPHITDIGFSAAEAAFVLSIMGASATGGRILMGIFSDRIGRKRIAVICALLLSGALLWLSGSQELWMIYLYAVVYGFAHGGFSVGLASLICDTFGLSRIGAILGVLDIGFGIGAASGPFIGGLLYDINSNYNTAFIIATLVTAAVALLTFLTRREIHTE